MIRRCYRLDGRDGTARRAGAHTPARVRGGCQGLQYRVRGRGRRHGSNPRPAVVSTPDHPLNMLGEVALDGLLHVQHATSRRCRAAAR